MEASRSQLLIVWDAFQAVLGQAVAAEQDAGAPLPPVPVWADELRSARGVAVEVVERPSKPRIDPEVRKEAIHAVRTVLTALEQEIAQGHGKASAGAAAALRNALKEFGKLIDDKLEHQAHIALAAAGELEGWQRWRADQLREELVGKAEGLLKRPEGQAVGGRKMQEMLRTLREQWKQTDQGGAANHALWKRFDEACNEAYKVVEAWLEKVKAESAEHRAQRLALIEEVNQWAEANRSALDDDWKGFNRILHQFGDRWRDAGHLGEKAFAELQPLWKAAIANAAEPLETMQKQSIALRQGMIEEAKVLGEAPELRLDAVKALQQRWQAQAHAVPVDRRLEQKLWDAFRKPIDDAFNRITQEREKAQATLGARDRSVLDAAKALEAANASGDAQAIKAAMAALDAALHGQAQAQAELTEAGSQEVQAQAVVSEEKNEENTAESQTEPAQAAIDFVAKKPAPKPVIAVRGDDRPGNKRDVPEAPAARGGKWGDKKDAGRRDGGRNDVGRKDSRPERWVEAPRLGDAAFRAQREALEHAEYALKKLAVQAHGEALTHFMTAWEKRDSAAMPTLQDLGSRVTAAGRTAWVAAITAPAKSPVPQALLRLEMAAELPTPAEHLDARRALQLQLLTRRNDPTPAQTWGADVAAVLASECNAADARRLQNVLKVMLRK
jgi:hypothetical protein